MARGIVTGIGFCAPAVITAAGHDSRRLLNRPRLPLFAFRMALPVAVHPKSA
jgi:hypothetical protein